MVLIALMMLFAHMFVDVISPLQEIIQKTHGWTPDVFGSFMGSEYLLNVLGNRAVCSELLELANNDYSKLLATLWCHLEIDHELILALREL